MRLWTWGEGGCEGDRQPTLFSANEGERDCIQGGHCVIPDMPTSQSVSGNVYGCYYLGGLDGGHVLTSGS